MGLCWILGLASVHEMCFRIHKDGAHSELPTDRATDGHATVTTAPKLSSARSRVKGAASRDEEAV